MIERMEKFFDSLWSLLISMGEERAKNYMNRTDRYY